MLNPLQSSCSQQLRRTVIVSISKQRRNTCVIWKRYKCPPDCPTTFSFAFFRRRNSHERTDNRVHNFFQAFSTRIQSSLQNSRNIPSPITYTHPSPYPLILFSTQIVARKDNDSSQKTGKINSLSRKEFSINGKKKKKMKGEESNDDAAAKIEKG